MYRRITEMDAIEAEKLKLLIGKKVAEIYTYKVSNNKDDGSIGLSNIRFTDGSMLFLDIVRTENGEWFASFSTGIKK